MSHVFAICVWAEFYDEDFLNGPYITSASISDKR